MRVRCIAESLTPEQSRAHYAPHPPPSGVSFAVTLGREYTVFDITWSSPFPMIGIEDSNGFEFLYPTPLCLFEIADPRLPTIWVARIRPDGVLEFAPPSFDDLYYDRLSDGVPAVLADFRRVRAQLQQDEQQASGP